MAGAASILHVLKRKEAVISRASCTSLEVIANPHRIHTLIECLLLILHEWS